VSESDGGVGLTEAESTGGGTVILGGRWGLE